MDYRLALVISLLLAPFTVQASSTVVYPKFKGLTTVTIPSTGQTVKAAGQGAVYDQVNNVFSFSGAAGSAAVFPYMAEAVGNAITARSPVVQSLAKKVAVGALQAAPGIILTAWALDFGLSYVAGQWGVTPSGDQYSITYGSCLPTHVQYGVRAGTLTAACSACQTHYGESPTGWHTGMNACLIQGGWRFGGIVGPGAMPAQSVPATQTDIDNLSENGRDLTPAELEAMIAAGWGVPIQNAPVTVIGDFSHLTPDELQTIQDMGFFQPTPESGAIPIGQPVLDPVSGQHKQPMLQFDPAPNAGVRLTPYQRPVDAQGQPLLDPQNNPLPNEKAELDPCTVNPSSIGCAPLGDLDGSAPAPDTTVVNLLPQAPWGSDGVCPAPAQLNFLGQPIEFSYDPYCTFFTWMKPVVLASAWITAILILVGARGSES